MKKFLFQIAIFLFLIGAILWMFLVIGTTVLPHDNPIRPVITSILGLPVDFVAKPHVATAESSAFEKWLYGDFITNFYSFATLTVIFGLFTITRGRSLIEKYMLLQAYALPRQRDHWGVIMDAKTSNPISFAVVKILKQDNERGEVFVSQTIADLDGRYRVYLASGKENYIMEVKAPGYQIYKQEVKSTLLEADGTITMNVLLKKENENIKLNPIRQFFRANRSRFLAFMTAFIFLISLTTCVSAAYTLIFHFNGIAFWNFVFYGLALPWNIFVLFERRQFSPGKTINYRDKEPVANVTIKATLPKGSLTILSDKNGIVKFDTDAGAYDVKVIRPGFVLKDNSQGTLSVKVNKDGYLENNIYLMPVTNTTVSDKNLQSPFGN